MKHPLLKHAKPETWTAAAQYLTHAHTHTHNTSRQCVRYTDKNSLSKDASSCLCIKMAECVSLSEAETGCRSQTTRWKHLQTFKIQVHFCQYKNTQTQCVCVCVLWGIPHQIPQHWWLGVGPGHPVTHCPKIIIFTLILAHLSLWGHSRTHL